MSIGAWELSIILLAYIPKLDDDADTTQNNASLIRTRFHRDWCESSLLMQKPW